MTNARTGGADSLLLPQEVADLFGVGVSAVRSWVRQGRIDVIRTPGNHMRFTRAAVDAARDRGSDGDTDGGDAATRAPDRQELPTGGPPETRWGGCGFPLPDDYRTGADGGYCYCGAPYAMHP